MKQSWEFNPIDATILDCYKVYRIQVEEEIMPFLCILFFATIGAVNPGRGRTIYTEVQEYTVVRSTCSGFIKQIKQMYH